MHRLRSLLAGAALATLAASPPAFAAVAPVHAQAVFQEAAQLCGRDRGALWHHSLCGPILLVDWTDNTAVANQADAQGLLKPQGAVFVGTLPPDFVIASTPIEWAGKR